MALQLSLDDDFGSTHASAYHRIVGCTLDIANKFAKVIVHTYVDSTARGNDKKPVKSRSFVIEGTDYDNVFGTTALDVASVNFISSAYVHLKTLGDFSGASDV